MKLHELHHQYNNPTYKTKFNPVKSGDTFTVYHGFNRLSDAVNTASHGLSGRSRARRIYSYEADNNPYGLFITLSMDIAKKFLGAHADKVIMEFVATYDELEAPVWPGGGYTVQGQMTQSFGGGSPGENRRRRINHRKNAEQEMGDSENYDHVNDSDEKYLASLLTASSEYQALYIGNLNPSDITAFWVRPDDGRDARYDKVNNWTKFTASEMIEKYGDKKDSEHDRVYKANDVFDGDEWIALMVDAYSEVKIDVEEGMKWMWDGVVKSKNKKQTFIQQFDNYLWPKQYKGAYRWMVRKWGK
jgi:hypothetical protein